MSNNSYLEHEVWSLKLLLLTPGWEKQGACESQFQTKAGRWWEQSMKTLRLGIFLHIMTGSQMTRDLLVNETFSWSKVQEKSNDG